jgi:hypothetical protein
MSIYRFDNWKEYISNENTLNKKSDTIVVILAFNQIEMVKNISKFYERQKIDVLFVDNNSNDGTYDFLIKNYSDKFNIVKTKENLGGAGGFAIGQEWVINKNYDYCILTEEDALPIDEDIIDELVKNKNKNTRVRSKFYELDQPSFSLHFNLYPVWLFKEIGVMNKELFFRADDWEFEQRLQNFLKNQSEFKTVDLDKKYSHPLIKKGFGMMANYFATRNGLLVYSKYPKKSRFFDISRVVIKDLWNGFFNLFNDKKITSLVQFKDGVIDAVDLNFSYKEKIEKFKSYKLEPNNYEYKELSIDEFINQYKNYKLKSELLLTSIIKGKFGNTSNKVISGKFNGAGRVLSFFAKDIVFVEEVDFMKKRITFMKISNNRLATIPILVITLSISLLISCFLIPYLYFKLKR